MLPIKICNNANEAEAETATTDADAIKAKEWHELTQPASLSHTGLNFTGRDSSSDRGSGDAMVRFEKNPLRLREFHFRTR